jgi:predicted porin
MKKSLLALAVLGAFAGVASAQSSVTLFGVIDESVNVQKSNGVRLVTLDANQLGSNRLGFQGTEDLGGGLKAGFWLEAGMNNGTGGGSATDGGLEFNRRSTVSLIGNFGEIRLGRDYTPSFWGTVLYDVYGANGLGEGLNMTTVGPQQSAFGSGATTQVRANNSVAYWLPSNIGGVYGRFMVAPSEGVSGNKYFGGSLNWAGGPIDAGVSYSTTKIIGASDFKFYNVGGSYDFGVAKLFALYNVSEWSPMKLKTEEISASFPFGTSAVNASFTHASYSGSTTSSFIGSGDQYSVQYIYNLSKRTAIYGTLAHTSNKNGADFAFGDVTVGADQSVNGANVGIRHSF